MTPVMLGVTASERSKKLSEKLSGIKTKCEQYWNESGPFVPEEVHSILGFIHVRACMAQDELAQAQADVEALQATIRSIERADETGDWSDYWDAVHRALAALPEHLRGASR